MPAPGSVPRASLSIPEPPPAAAVLDASHVGTVCLLHCMKGCFFWLLRGVFCLREFPAPEQKAGQPDNGEAGTAFRTTQGLPPRSVPQGPRQSTDRERAQPSLPPAQTWELPKQVRPSPWNSLSVEWGP